MKLMELKEAYREQYDVFTRAIAKNNFVIAFQEGKDENEVISRVREEIGVIGKTRKELLNEEKKDLKNNIEALEVIKGLIDGNLKTTTTGKRDS